MPLRTIPFGDGEVPTLGQGTWFMGEDRDERAGEVRCPATGPGPRHDADRHGGDVCRRRSRGGRRRGDRRAGGTIASWSARPIRRTPAAAAPIQACERSLKRLGTDYLDLYLLHWRGGIPLAETVEAFETLRQQGKIRRWGVSNLDTDDMKELLSVPGGQRLRHRSGALQPDAARTGMGPAALVPRQGHSR